MRKDTNARTLGDIIGDADIFLGVSAAGVLKPDMVQRMAAGPLIMALANPNPEIMPEEARAAKPDAMICTGRSDYPNQVNNVLCFPYIFRGALDCGATADQRGDEAHAVRAIANLAREEALRRGRARLFRRGRHVRRRQPHPVALRSAPDPAHRARGRPRGHGHRRRDAPHCRFRGLCGKPDALRIPVGPSS
jgi:malic enzyme